VELDLPNTYMISLHVEVQLAKPFLTVMNCQATKLCLQRNQPNSELWPLSTTQERVFMKCGMYTIPMEYTQMYFSISHY